MTFELQHTDPYSDARSGVLTTDHGQIKTPIFMPVGTVGSVKGVHFQELHEQVKAQIILGNTYHLYLRPGLDTLRKAGGLHRFNTWDGPILTDSGGFQVFSLTGIRKLREEGCEFRSHIDGSKHIFTPENVMDTQRIIGADIMMALDECPPGQSDYQYAKRSLGLTQRWLDRCIKRFNESEPLYGLKDVLRGTHTHEIAGTILRQDLVDYFNHLVHHLRRFSHSQSSDTDTATVIQLAEHVDHMLGCVLAQILIGAALHNGEEGLPVAVEGFCGVEPLDAAFQPALGQPEALLGIVVVAISRRALVEGHHDVGSNDALGVHHVLRGEYVLRTVDMAAELTSLLTQFTDASQREDLKAA